MNKWNLLHDNVVVLSTHAPLWVRQPADDVWQQVVDRIVLRSGNKQGMRQPPKPSLHTSWWEE